MPGFCFSQAVAHVRARSPIQPYKKSVHLMAGDDKTTEFSSKNSTEMSFNGSDQRTEGEGRNNNRVMVVVDMSIEAKGALQWALSHTVHTQDTIILLLVTKPFKQGESSFNCELDQRAYELLCSMKNMCQTRRPGVQVEIVVQEGKEKGAAIVEAAKQQKASLLVLGQRKRSVMWRMRTMWSGKRAQQSKVVSYCIQNAGCLAIAVRRKSRRHGGYLITTKRHKDFWLLA
nr:uncharacterized protein LOC109162818 [Ipomoea batatas]